MNVTEIFLKVSTFSIILQSYNSSNKKWVYSKDTSVGMSSFVNVNDYTSSIHYVAMKIKISKCFKSIIIESIDENTTGYCT